LGGCGRETGSRKNQENIEKHFDLTGKKNHTTKVYNWFRGGGKKKTDPQFLPLRKKFVSTAKSNQAVRGALFEIGDRGYQGEDPEDTKKKPKTTHWFEVGEKRPQQVRRKKWLKKKAQGC